MADSGTDDMYSRFDNANNGWTNAEGRKCYRALCAMQRMLKRGKCSIVLIRGIFRVQCSDVQKFAYSFQISA